MTERRRSLSVIITPDNRQSILFDMFGDIGELEEEDFSCALDTTHLLIHGRMYMGSKAVCFYSSLLGNEKNIKIPFETIKWYSKQNTALIIPNAIEITANGSEGEEKYVFRSFLSRNKVFQLIDDHMHNLHEETEAAVHASPVRADGDSEKLRVFQKVMDSSKTTGSNSSGASTPALHLPSAR